jgi:F1F0 ATPase subunit 2
MPELVRLLVPAVGGASIAALYFGGLWWTVRRLPEASHPAALVLGSFVGRAVLAALGFTVLLAGDPVRLAVALVAFLAVRAVAVRRVRLGAAPAGGAPR